MQNTAKKSYLFIGMISIILGLLIVAFILIANEISKDALVQFDRSIIGAVQSNISPFLTGLMEVFTFLGTAKWISAAAVISAVWLFIKKKWSLGVFIVLSSGSGFLFNVILKDIFKRQRPDIHRLISANGYSFPSGHSMSSLIFYGALAYILIHYTNKKGRQVLGVILLAVLVLFIGLSRIYLGVHFPSDIIGGYVAGGAWLMICIIIFRYYEYRKNL